MVVTLLQNIDSLKNVVLIAATNHEKLLDKAVWRRFNYKIEISLPIDTVRENIVKQLITENIDRKIMDIIIELTEGMSGADIESVCYEYLKEKTIEKDVSINKLLLFILMEHIPELKIESIVKKDIILLIKSKYNLSYEKIAIILNISKAYVAKIIKGSINAK